MADINSQLPVFDAADGTDGASAPSAAVQVAGKDGSGNLQAILTDTAGIVAINPRNAAGTETGTSSTPLRIDPTGTTTQPISAVSLPLPTGAATSSLQTTGNTSVASIDSKLGTLGQKAMSGSAPVVLASDQSAIPASQSGTWNINNVSGTVSLPTGAATAANQSTIITSVQLLDDVPSANNAAFSKGNPIMGQMDDTSTVLATENNVSALRITPYRAVHSNLRDSSGVELATPSNPLPVTASPVTDSKYSTNFFMTQSAASAAGTTVFTMRNAVGSTKSVYITSLSLVISNFGAGNNSVSIYAIQRFNTATPTGGTTRSVIGMSSSNAASNVTDVRFLDTGLSTTGVVFEADLALMPFSNGQFFSSTFTITEPIMLAAGEGLAVRINQVVRINNTVSANIFWVER